ncbi:glycoside hydrolase family 127 protein [Flavobacterium daejeonense]|uniref:glycoside hydrolase family 127 protein n=1 Tax=Flavobacterium daejeonense TaxID=350893 RepID=UPI00047BC46C|nr:glycoside hydrolase family 127 protein [Flavobacterium daejeonense]
MNKVFLSLLLCSCLTLQAQKKDKVGYPISPVPFTSVKVNDAFWGQRLQASREVTIPLAFSKCEETGRYKNFQMAAHPSESNKVEGFTFDDTDVYKTIEGASYSMQTFPNPKLDRYIDSVLTIVAKAQEPDGYLYTFRTMNPKHTHEWVGSKRWEKEENLSHELYNLGHMVEGAIAHYQATGKKNFLDIAIKFADCAIREVGDKPGQTMVVPGHQIAEMALSKLYIFTGQKKYLDFAKLLLDKRGKTTFKSEYSQSHLPVLKQEEAVGHAVRAAYMYSGMADVAALSGDKEYIDAINHIWNNIVSKKLYITGGIGATGSGEAFGANYDLPNMSAYCETCAAIGNVYLNHRLFLLHGDAKYYDVLERTLYNGLISGVSLDGGGFFYPNPLESNGQHQRQAWFGCACCPSNICRFIPSVPGYIYAVHDNDLYVNLFMANHSDINVNGKIVNIKQVTRYPWVGDVTLEIAPKTKQDFNLKIRVPGWVQNNVVSSNLYSYADKKSLNYTIKVNGKLVNSKIEKGYFSIQRIWKKGDQVDIHFDMETRTVKANQAVEADRGKIAVERGPIVYCAEWPDNDFSIFSVIMNKKPLFNVEFKKDLLSGINEIQTQAQTLSYDDNGKLIAKDVQLNLIPYYAWAHRGSGDMAVWLPVELNATRPSMPPTIASESEINASHNVKSIAAINDGIVPKEDKDRALPYYHWWPKEGTTEWISYDFNSERTISRSTVYWYDDKPWGGCQVPQSWVLYYKDNSGAWKPVENSSVYGVEKGFGNEVVFNPVTTKAMKLEVKLAEKNAAGIFEWSIE